MTAPGLRVPESVSLGQPGVYVLPEAAAPVLAIEPMDVAAFVGVAPRGPAWEVVDDPARADSGVALARSIAVPVDNWDDYVDHFGAFEGPGLLPHAVAAFFAQGGRRAYVVRIVHDEHGWDGARPVPFGCALHELGVPGLAPPQQPVVASDGSPLRFRARNEGTWGDNLEVTLSFSARPLAFESVQASSVVLPAGFAVPAGTLLRLQGAAGEAALRRVTRMERRGRPDGPAIDAVAVLDSPVGFVAVRVDEVLADVSVVDRDPARIRHERFTGLGFDPVHPAWLGNALQSGSWLVALADPVDGITVRNDALPPVGTHLTSGGGGDDRWQLITPADVFGRVLEGDESGTDGLDALLHAPEVASLVAPDLYSPGPIPHVEAVSDAGVFAGPDFAPCLDHPPSVQPPEPPADLIGLRLDPASAADLETIIGLQRELVTVAEHLQVVALLDVPPGLRHRAVLRWRARFDSSFAAAYHPWPRVPMAQPGGPLVHLPPSAAAAGIIARCERREGVPRGPANEAVVTAVDLIDRVDDAAHAELHPLGVNVLRREPGGIWLTGARTLSRDRQFRQLTVRRLLMLLERVVARQLIWTVFEPNDDQLRAGLRRMIEHLLGDLFARGAFAGATPAESWFVDVASGADASAEADRGELVVRIGVAPSEPTEFILVRLTLDRDGQLAVETSATAGVAVHG